MYTFVATITFTHVQLPQLSDAPINKEKTELSTDLTILRKPKKVQTLFKAEWL